MGSLIPQKLGMDFSFSFLPRTINGLFAESMKFGDQSAKTTILAGYIDGLEDEMKKIAGLKRELPHIVLLLNDAIVTMKEELVKCKRLNQEPVLEEFLPLKKSTSGDEKYEKSENCKQMDVVKSKDKMDWMRSVQLWNSDHIDKKRKESDRTLMDSPIKNRTMERAFMPFKMAKKDKDETSGLSLRMPDIKNLMDNHNISLKAGFSRSNSDYEHQQSIRKQRRCWSPELHQRFIDALKQLGGHEVATPKQIRELMQVDGLTNDEVKSHLQKYRLHLRKAQANAQDEPSIRNKMLSDSPEGHFHSNVFSSTNVGDSYEDEDNEKSESIQLSCRDL